ncbi:MAG: hypothetical protein HC796_04080 [Synechococcaceae cyanobacterium RL_1_2]|nr:hypothetical protein [Synechococcaceae cyanobacterium RL_1_2]
MPNEKLAILFLSLSIITSSIYVFPSGSPQLTDFLSLIAFFALISKRQALEFVLENIKEKKTLIIFVGIYSFANIFSLRFFPEVSIDGTLTAIAYVYFNVTIYLSFNYFFTSPIAITIY